MDLLADRLLSRAAAEALNAKRFIGAFERLIRVSVNPERWQCEWCGAEAGHHEATFPHGEDCPTPLFRGLREQDDARRRTWRKLVTVADAAYHALESYAHGNAACDLARECATALNDALESTRDSY